MKKSDRDNISDCSKSNYNVAFILLVSVTIFIR
jgi:hypothetical protein